jgi:hypothetical protein
LGNEWAGAGQEMAGGNPALPLLGKKKNAKVLAFAFFVVNIN